MTIDTQFNQVVSTLLTNPLRNAPTAEQVLHCIDLTLLEEQPAADALVQLNHDANRYKVAAICVYTQHLAAFPPPNSTTLATVVNFPHGKDDIKVSLADLDKAVAAGAQEIDYVLPYQAYLNGEAQMVLNQCQAVVAACKNKNLCLKIILETGAFPHSQSIYALSKELIALGCDFLKTSTGKITPGATLAAVFAILAAIKDFGSPCGLKVSGGVKTTQQANLYATLAELILAKKIDKSWFRIGASSLLNELVSVDLAPVLSPADEMERDPSKK